MKERSTATRHCHTRLMFPLWAVWSLCITAWATLQADYQLVERTQDSATYQRVVQLTNDSREVITQTNLLTVLDHGMHYLQDGEYQEIQDLVESFPDGAIARYGAYQTIFSPELNVQAAFDIQTPDAKRIRGGVRTIQLTDIATGKSVVVGTVKNSANF